MGGLRMTRNDLATYELLSRAGNDFKGGMLQLGLTKAADVKPETVDSTDLTETTLGTDGMVYDEDTGQYLPKYIDGGQPTEQAQAQMNTPADGTSKAPEGMRPTFSAKTTRRHKMGSLEQADPFSEDQVSAESARRRSRVLGASGDFKGEAELSGMAKKYDDSHNTAAINSAGKLATKGLENEHPSIQAMARNTAMMNKAAELREMEKAMTHFTMSQALSDSVFDDLLTDANRKRAVGDWSGVRKLLDYGIADGNKSDVTPNADGSVTLKYGGKETIVPADRIDDQLTMLADKKARRAFALKSLEQKLTTAAEQAKSDIKDKSAIGQAETKLKTSTANYYDGAKTVQAEAAAAASRARAEGAGGPSIGQQRLDATQFNGFIKENSSFYELPSPMEEGKYITNRVARDTFTAAARRNPELAQQTFMQMRAAAEADAADAEGNVDPQKMNASYIKRVNSFAQRLATPKPPPTVPPPSKPAAASQGGMARADIPRPAAPIAQPAAADSRFNEAGYINTASTIAGAARGDKNALALLSRMADEGGLTATERMQIGRLLSR